MRRTLLTISLLALGACASSQSATPAVQHAEAAAAPPAPPPPPIPQDPLDLVAGDVSMLASARIDVMKDKDAFAAVRRSLTRYGCVSAADFDWLAGQTQRAFMVSRGDANQPEFVVILAGQFSEPDAGRALDLLARRVGTTDAATSRTQGRFNISQKGPWSAIVLEDRLLVAGHAGFVGSTLDVIDHPPEARYAQSAIFKELGDHVNCLDRSLCALITPDGSVAQRMKGELAGVGMKKVGRELASGQSGFTVSVGDGVVLNAGAHLQNDEDANSLAKDTKDWLWQAGLVARLAGFPDVLGDAEVKTEGSFTELKIKVGQGDLARLEQRLDQMIGDDAAARCAPSAAAALGGETPRPIASLEHDEATRPIAVKPRADTARIAASTAGTTQGS
jgi:hypothetical protein